MTYDQAATLADVFEQQGITAHTMMSYGTPFMSAEHFVYLSAPAAPGHNYVGADYLGLYLNCDDQREQLAQAEDRAGEPAPEYTDQELEAMWLAEQERVAAVAEIMHAGTPGAA